MANPIDSTLHSEPTHADTSSAKQIPSSQTAPQKSPQTQSKPAPVPQDTITISNAARSALQQATGAKTQDVKEATSGERPQQPSALQSTGKASQA
jgi:hypothetical protein